MASTADKVCVVFLLKCIVLRVFSVKTVGLRKNIMIIQIYVQIMSRDRVLGPKITSASILIVGSWCRKNLTFPPSFKFGAASAAYQVEGGWNASDKGESCWDHILHAQPELISDGTNGDVACDSYHLWRRDIEMMEELGLDMYRFSISWSRLLPTGFPNHISEDGKNYYGNLIDGLLEKGIAPMVTLYHFDLPQPLQDLGGWANPLIADWFADYARVVFSLYADRVKIWLTLNEPIGICDNGYTRRAAPYIEDMLIGRNLCNKYAMIAHAKAWRIYDEEYKPKYHGKVSLATMFFWFEPATPEDVEVTDLTIAYWEGRYAYPIFSKEGGWPPSLEKALAEYSKREGYPTSTLPPFTQEEIELVRGTYDFYGLNHYSTSLVRKAKPGEGSGYWPFGGPQELGVAMEKDPTWDTTDLDWFAVYPEGLYRQLHWLKNMYNISEFIITENGYLSFSDQLDDYNRLNYIKEHLNSVLLALQDGINVSGYTVWTLMDNFEWGAGYSVKIGLYAVNFTSPMRTRTPRASAKFYADVIKSRTVY